MTQRIGEIGTKKLFAAKLSTAPLPAKKPRPRGLYGTSPMPSSLHAQSIKTQESILMLQDKKIFLIVAVIQKR